MNTTKIPTNIHLMTAELHKAFELINKKFFDGRIPLPAITIQSNGNRKLSMGWCTTKEVWGDKEGIQKMYEINLSAEFIDLSFIETMDTLMHEMVHLYNIVTNVQDVSRNGTYHNKRFLERAVKSGFIHPNTKPDPKYGYSFVKLSPITITLLNEMDIDQSIFSIGRREPGYFESLNEEGNSSEEVAKKTPTGYRWFCPKCNMILRSTKPKLNIICGDCELQLIQTE